MTHTLRAALIAPLPILVLVVLVRPSLGWADATYSGLMAVAASYGFMLVAGLPAHLILQRLGWKTWPHYLSGFLLALLIVVFLLTASEGPPPELSPDDSPFASFTLRGGGWLLMFAACSPLAAVMASMFWQRAVSDS